MSSNDFAEDLKAIYEVAEDVEYQADGFGMDYQFLMMGTSGVGKTVYMTTMLYEFLKAKKGLRVETDEALRREIEQNYEELRNTGDLQATARLTEWNFSVFHDDMDLFKFKWIDYRGDSVDYFQKIVSEPDVGDFPQVFEYLKNAIAVFVLADAEALKKDPEKVRKELLGIRILIEASMKRSRRGLHLVLVLTKSDAVGLKTGLLGKKQWDGLKLFTTYNQAFAGIFDDFLKEYDDIICDIIPISSYGTSAIEKDGRMVLNGRDKLINSYQVQLPLRKAFTSILFDLSRRLPHLLMEAAEDSDEKRKAIRKQEASFSEKFSLRQIMTREGREKLKKHRIHKIANRNLLRASDFMIDYLKKKIDIAERLVNEVESDPKALYHRY